MRIDDPLNSNAARVSDDGRLLVGVDDLEGKLEAAALLGDAFIISSTYAATAAQDVLDIKNTDELKDLIIDKIILSALAATLFTGSAATGTAGGTPLTVFPLKSSVAVGRSLEAFGSASVTGLTGATAKLAVHVGVGTPVTVRLGLILSEGANFALETSVTTTVAITVIGRWL